MTKSGNHFKLTFVIINQLGAGFCYFRRCSLPIVNPKTGEKKGEEPLATLRR